MGAFLLTKTRARITGLVVGPFRQSAQQHRHPITEPDRAINLVEPAPLVRVTCWGCPLRFHLPRGSSAEACEVAEGASPGGLTPR